MIFLLYAAIHSTARTPAPPREYSPSAVAGVFAALCALAHTDNPNSSRLGLISKGLQSA